MEEDELLTPDLALYEITNSIWKHQHILKDLENGLPYISILYGLFDSGAIRIVPPNEELMRRSYEIAARNKTSIYDTVFIALALETDLELKHSINNKSNISKLFRITLPG